MDPDITLVLLFNRRILARFDWQGMWICETSNGNAPWYQSGISVMGIRVAVWVSEWSSLLKSSRSFSQNNQNPQKTPVNYPRALWQSHGFSCHCQTEPKPLETAELQKPAQSWSQQAQKIWGYSFITWAAVRTHISLQMRWKLSCHQYRRQMKSNPGGEHSALWHPAPPELHLFISPSIRTILHSQNTLREISMKRNKQTPSAGPDGIHPRALEELGMLSSDPSPSSASLGSSQLTKIIPTCTKGLGERPYSPFSLFSAPGEFYL